MQVIIGADEYGETEVRAILDGFRETVESWRDLRKGLKKRGPVCRQSGCAARAGHRPLSAASSGCACGITDEVEDGINQRQPAA